MAEFELLERIISRHSALFGQSSIRDITVFNTSSLNLVFFFNSAGVDFVLKVMKKGARNEFTVMQEAGRHITVPEALSYGQIDEDEFLLMKRAKGRDSQSILPQMDKTTKANFLHESAITLARLHRSTWNIRQPDKLESTRAVDTDELAIRLDNFGVKNWSGITTLKSMEPEKSSSSVCLVHGRFCPSNIMLSRNRITGIVDWPDSRWASPGIDLGYALFMLKVNGLDGRMFLRSYLDEWNRPIQTDLHEKSKTLFPPEITEHLPFFETMAAIEIYAVSEYARTDPRMEDVLHNPVYAWILRAVESAKQIALQLEV